jgi:hypothetical protein
MILLAVESLSNSFRYSMSKTCKLIQVAATSPKEYLTRLISCVVPADTTILWPVLTPAACTGHEDEVTVYCSSDARTIVTASYDWTWKVLFSDDK